MFLLLSGDEILHLFLAAHSNDMASLAGQAAVLVHLQGRSVHGEN